VVVVGTVDVVLVVDVVVVGTVDVVLVVDVVVVGTVDVVLVVDVVVVGTVDVVLVVDVVVVGTVVIDTDWVAVRAGTDESVTCTLNDDVPESLGVPLMVPSLVNSSPAGRSPDSSVHE
jgi:hypothetical protein